MDSAAFNTYKNALENTIHDIPHRESHQMSSSNEDQYQQHPQLGYDAQRVVLEQSIDQEQTELQYSEHYLGNEAVEEDDEEDEEF